MSIIVKKHDEYKLKIPEYICDKILKQDVPEPYNLLINGYRFIVIVGRPQSGKSSLLISLFRDKLLLRKCWNNVILCCPVESIKSLKKSDNPFKDLSGEKYYTDLSDINRIREQIKYYASEGENTVLIIDDQTAHLKDVMVQKTLSDLVYNRRHYRVSIILLTQIYNKIPLSIRKLINIIIVMYKPSKKEFQDVVQELLEYNEDIAQKIFNISFQKQFDKLMIDIPQQLVFHNSDELIVQEE